MSRRKSQNAGIPGVGTIPYVQHPNMSGNTGGGGSKLPYGTLNIQLGKKGITVAGANIQTVTLPLKTKQQGQSQPQQGGFPWQGSGGQGGQGINPQAAIQHCILAATTQAQIAAQQFSLSQQAQAANQQLLTALTTFGAAMGMAPMTKAQRRQYQQPQARVQQTRRKKQGAQNQQQANQSLQFA